jgi:hypothetical protein
MAKERIEKVLPRQRQVHFERNGNGKAILKAKALRWHKGPSAAKARAL